MSALERFARRVPFLRFCILTHLRHERKKQADIRWEYQRTVYSTLGQAISAWASIEMMIDHLIEWYHPLAGEKNIRPDLPVTFDSKMNYMNKMARDPGFDDGGETIRHIRTEAKRLNKDRKMMVHGVMWHTHPHSLNWLVEVRNFKGPNAEVIRYSFKLEDLTETLRQMSELMGVVSPWVASVSGLNKFLSTGDSILYAPTSVPPSARSGTETPPARE